MTSCSFQRGIRHLRYLRDLERLLGRGMKERGLRSMIVAAAKRWCPLGSLGGDTMVMVVLETRLSRLFSTAARNSNPI